MENVSQSRSVVSGPASASSGLETGHLSTRTLGLVSCGGIGALLFTSTYLIEGVTRPGYDALRQPVSALSLGPGGWLQQANFIVYGILLALSAVGWYRVLWPERSAFWFSLFQGISGLCLIGAGLFSMDPWPGYPPGVVPGASTTHGTLHGIFAWTLILALVLGCFTLAPHFRRIPHWRGWAAYSVLSGVLILVFWGSFTQGASGTVATFASFAGLAERLAAGSHDLWLCALTATLLARRWRRREASPQSVSGADAP